MVEHSQGTSKRQQGTGKPRGRRRIAPRFTIGFRFVTFVVLVALMAGGGVGFALTNTSRDSLRQEVLHNNLAQADLAAQFASTYMNTIQAHIKVFANRPDIRQAVLNNTPEQAQPALAQFVQIQTALNGAGIYDINGIQGAYSIADATTLGQSFADRDWFQQAVATGQPYQGAPAISRGTGVPVVPYAVPILDEQGKVRGVLSGGIALRKLAEAIVNIGYGADTRASMIDFRNGGVIIAHVEAKA